MVGTQGTLMMCRSGEQRRRIECHAHCQGQLSRQPFWCRHWHADLSLPNRTASSATTCSAGVSSQPLTWQRHSTLQQRRHLLQQQRVTRKQWHLGQQRTARQQRHLHMRRGCKGGE